MGPCVDDIKKKQEEDIGYSLNGNGNRKQKGEDG